MALISSIVGLPILLLRMQGQIQDFLKGQNIEVIFETRSLGYRPLEAIVLVVTQARVLCLICIPEALGPAALRLLAYISGKALVPVLQLICYTSGTLKSAQT